MKIDVRMGIRNAPEGSQDRDADDFCAVSEVLSEQHDGAGSADDEVLHEDRWRVPLDVENVQVCVAHR